MKNILFNSGSTYSHGGETMKIIDLQSIDVKNTKKEDLPWLQVFNCGYRVTSENLDWNYWNGCVFVDVDSKRYYNDVKQFDAKRLLDLLYDYLLINYNDNFYNIQISNSGTSYHIMFYFDVEKNEDNFKKCSAYAQDIVRTSFKAIGAEDIILYEKVIDKCCLSQYQGIYITKNEILFGSIEDPFFGSFNNIDNYEAPKKKILEKSDISKDGTKLFKLDDFKQISNKVPYKDHHQRWSIYEALIAVFNDKETVDNNWKYICSKLETGEHSERFFLKEPDKNKWYDKYTGEYVKVNKLEEFGYHFTKLFEPANIDLYIPDILYELTENQTLSDLKIEWDSERINHLYAGCGLGKTFMGKKYGKEIGNRDTLDFIFNHFDEMFGKGVCFISPMKSINRDSFKNESDWVIIDSDNKEDNIDKYGSIKEAIDNKKNICTTWESFVLYEMYKLDFSYVIVDEIHTLYMYDYRIKSITDLKKYLQIAKGTKIIMTGTPSNEINEFDCKKIEVRRKVKKVKCEILFYNKQYTGYIINDIKDWIKKDKNNYAIIFEDRTNFKTQEKLKTYGIDCDIFNQNFVDTVNYIIENQNVKEQVTAFSVYGQAGINLWVDKDKKFRIYILSNNSLGIIQYANRIRNKECIDKVIVPYKVERIDNDINQQSTDIDFGEAERKINIINSTIKSYDLFSNKNKSIFELRYGISVDCLDTLDNKYVLNKDRYTTYKLIKNVEEYEKQIQLIYNRLVSNDFDVKLNYMIKDTKTIKATHLRSNQFAGQMSSFDFDMLSENKEHIKLNPTNNFLKVCTGSLIDDIEYILDHIYVNNNYDFDTTKKEFANMLMNILKRNQSIKKIDIKRICTMMHLSKHWDDFYNNAFITAMLDSKWDNYKLTAVYIRSIYNDTMNEDDIHHLSDEAYDNIVSLRKVIDDYKDIFIELAKHTSSMNIPNDDIVKKVYMYVANKHTHGRPKKI